MTCSDPYDLIYTTSSRNTAFQLNNSKSLSQSYLLFLKKVTINPAEPNKCFSSELSKWILQEYLFILGSANYSGHKSKMKKTKAIIEKKKKKCKGLHNFILRETFHVILAGLTVTNISEMWIVINNFKDGCYTIKSQEKLVSRGGSCGSTSCVGLDLCGLRWVSDLGVRCAVSDLLEEEADLLTLMVGSSRCLVTGERSTLESPAGWGVAPMRRAAATSIRKDRKRIIRVLGEQQSPLVNLVNLLAGWNSWLACRRCEIWTWLIRTVKDKKILSPSVSCQRSQYLMSTCVTPQRLRGLTGSTLNRHSAPHPRALTLVMMGITRRGARLLQWGCRWEHAVHVMSDGTKENKEYQDNQNPQGRTECPLPPHSRRLFHPMSQQCRLKHSKSAGERGWLL